VRRLWRYGITVIMTDGGYEGYKIMVLFGGQHHYRVLSAP